MYGQDQRIGEWARELSDERRLWNAGYRAIGLQRNGILIAGVAYTDYYGGSIAGHITATAPLTRPFVRALFAYPFLQLKCRRFSAWVPARKRHVQHFVERLGFTYESRMERALLDDDVLVYRMFPTDCRWLPELKK